jgi:hypothetical protein
MGNRVAALGASAVWPSRVVGAFGALEPKAPFPLCRIATECSASDRVGHSASASWQRTS